MLIPVLEGVDYRHAEKHLGRQSDVRLDMQSIDTNLCDLIDRIALAVLRHNPSERAVKLHKRISLVEEA